MDHMLMLVYHHSDHKYIRPTSIHSKDIVDEYAKDYMYLSCVKFVNQVHFIEHNIFQSLNAVQVKTASLK
jgi:hypothetical protein